ncbi:MAG: PAS domain-containing sensor histidine kinase [Methanoregula sp.]|jgi:PAS domain S-box-containing protein
MEGVFNVWGHRVTHTDVVRICVIASLALSTLLITTLAFERNLGSLYSQLIYFPILYATYFYPKRGLIVAGICGVAYECIAYFFLYPDTFALWSATAQAVLFICIAMAVVYLTEAIRVSEARYRSIFENSLLGIILFDRNTFAIKLANQQIAEVLGYTPDELAKQQFSSLFASREFQRSFFGQLGSGENTRKFETCFLTKTGNPHWVNLSWSRIDDLLVSCSVIDIHVQKISEQSAAENAAQYRKLTESSPTGIVIMDNGQIVFANPAFLEFSGYKAQECREKPFEDFIQDGDRDRFREFFGKWGAPAPVPDRAEFRFRSKTGETRKAMLYFTPITRNNGPAALLSLIDNTEWEAFRTQVEQTNERRRDIMQAVAHEIRTPLQPIIGYINLLIQDPAAFGLNEEALRILDRCAKSVDRERQIINQMLEISVMEAGDTRLDYSVLSVPNLVAEIIDDGGYTLKADIRTEIPPGLTVEADRRKLALVLNTLIANGVAYAKPPKKVTITYRNDPTHPFHQIAVQDNGIGITEAQLDRIFEPGENVTDSGDPAEKTGEREFPLAIAKKYIHLHGGYISVESIGNIGSTFIVHIPKQKQKPGDSHATA